MHKGAIYVGNSWYFTGIQRDDHIHIMQRQISVIERVFNVHVDDAATLFLWPAVDT
eukprot:CAMPEP_0182462610 /NCGR_PEP_ID=MMETSP1319-20130603/6820_1 /TAXON_ID=172717 /ORGANISM="Bolidomonas pacifica, Strain RCC208" /LENGTH=55 /DNA_ID=CAMNT_0024662053 /DNA_START=183 /DNA_END=347 /DNA_ORIENTATION=+